jgi:hypothetical protein
MIAKPWVAHLSRAEKRLRREAIRRAACRRWAEASCPPGRYPEFWRRAGQEYDWLLFRRWQDRPCGAWALPVHQTRPALALAGYNVHGMPNPPPAPTTGAFGLPRAG